MNNWFLIVIFFILLTVIYWRRSQHKKEAYPLNYYFDIPAYIRDDRVAYEILRESLKSSCNALVRDFDCCGGTLLIPVAKVFIGKSPAVHDEFVAACKEAEEWSDYTGSFVRLTRQYSQIVVEMIPSPTAVVFQDRIRQRGIKPHWLSDDDRVIMSLQNDLMDEVYHTFEFKIP